MTEERLKEIQKDSAGNEVLKFIPNNLGINLCSVEDVIINRQKDSQLTDIKIIFIPSANS